MARKQNNRKPGMVRLIGVFRLLKAVLLLAIGFGALKFLHRDLASQIQNWFQHWQIDPDNRYLEAVMSKVTHLNSRNLVLVGAGTIFYATLFLIEGIGLLMMKRWAEIFTVIVTGAFIPLEIYHLVRHFSGMKVVVIFVNIAIVIYLLWRLKKERNAT